MDNGPYGRTSHSGHVGWWPQKNIILDAIYYCTYQATWSLCLVDSSRVLALNLLYAHHTLPAPRLFSSLIATLNTCWHFGCFIALSFLALVSGYLHSYHTIIIVRVIFRRLLIPLWFYTLLRLFRYFCPVYIIHETILNAITLRAIVDANTWNGWINIGNVYKYLDLYTLQSIFKIIPIKYDCLLFTFACLTVIGSRLIASEQIQLASYQDLSLKRKSGSYKINKHFQTVTANFCDNERNNRRLIRNVDPTNSRFTDHSPISHRSNVYARLSADLHQCSSKNFATVNSLATVRDFPHVLTDFMR